MPDQASKERLAAALSGRYEIDREIGQGGMAVVYLARDIKHDRKVALKVLRPELSSAMGIDRFPREIHIIAQMHHPHILPLHDSGEVEGFLYYVMPYVEGETLRTKLARGPLSINEGVRLLREITDALAYAHAHGVIHRDIKPDNVMIAGKHAAVTDFGIAKAVHSAARDKLTTVGIAVGTPQYMSPEQAMAEPNVDHRADIYSVGVLGYEILTGHPVFEGSSQAILSAHVLEVPKDIRERRPEVPALLAEALLKCLAKDPANRWQSAEDLLDQLELVATTPSGGMTPTNTRPFKAAPSAATPTAAANGGRKTMRIAIAAVAVLALGVAGTLFARSGGGSGRIEKIGVMPIEDISGQDAVFVNAMHDGLTNALARLHLAGVASHTEMMRYKGASKTTRDIAKENRLDAVIEATVFRAGDIMRINVQFTDPVTSKSLWSETYSPNVSDVLAAQSSVVEKISAGVKGALAPPK